MGRTGFTDKQQAALYWSRRHRLERDHGGATPIPEVPVVPHHYDIVASPEQIVITINDVPSKDVIYVLSFLSTGGRDIIRNFHVTESMDTAAILQALTEAFIANHVHFTYEVTGGNVVTLVPIIPVGETSATFSTARITGNDGTNWPWPPIP